MPLNMYRGASLIWYRLPVSVKYTQAKGKKMSELFDIQVFENSRGSWTVLKINTITNSATDIQTFADKNSAIAFAFDNSWKVAN